jgi:branched-chain amino acid aminotransferase
MIKVKRRNFMDNLKIKITPTTRRKEKIPAEQLEFGKTFTDHMFVMDYIEGKGWHNAQIVPYQPISLDPSAMIFHYGQSVFEGLKAYVSKEGKILLFRPEQNFKRMNRSNDRLCIPEIDEDFALEGLKQLVTLDQDWIPEAEGTSLYIRPFIISTKPYLGVSPSDEYKLIIIMSPVGSYYKEGLDPVKIHVESQYVRAAAGGTGKAKTGGNYAASLKAQADAADKGYSQVLWLDAAEKRFIEEVGSMNIFFKINGEVVTPALNESILEGITRKSTIELLKHWGINVIERKISVEEIFEAYEAGLLEEAFGTGTAAVISPVGELRWKDQEILINNCETGELSKKIYDTITGIQTGKLPDPFGWIVEVGQKQGIPAK